MLYIGAPSIPSDIPWRGGDRAHLVHTTHRRAGRRAEQAGCNRADLRFRPVDLQVSSPCWVYCNWQFVAFSHHTCPPLQPPPPSACQYPTGARPERTGSGEVDGRPAQVPVSGPPPDLLPFRNTTSSFPPCHATYTCLGPAEWVCQMNVPVGGEGGGGAGDRGRGGRGQRAATVAPIPNPDGDIQASQ